MATGYSSADRFSEAQDYSRSHRRPPPIPTSPPPPPPPLSPREHFSLAVANAIGTAAPRRSEQLPDSRSLARLDSPTPGTPLKKTNTARPVSAAAAADHDHDLDTDATSGRAVGGRRTRAVSASAGVSRSRKGSLSFLRKSHTNNTSTRKSLDSAEPPYYVSEATAPPLPTTLFAQARQEAADRPRTRGSSTSATMLRKVSGLGSRARKEQEERAKREAAQQQPRLPPPHLPPLPGMSSFHEERPDSVAIFNHSYTTTTNTTAPRSAANFSRPSFSQAMSSSSAQGGSSPPAHSTGRADSALNSSSPPTAAAKVNGVHRSGEYVAADLPDNYSMANRGRFSYASTATNINAVNSPRRVRRKKDPTPFNILVVGAKNCGKTSFISFLKHSLALPPGKLPYGSEPDSQTSPGNRANSSFTPTYLESEIEGERIGLTLWDSQGLEKNVADLQCRELATFVESKFEDTFAEEQKVMRTPGVKDTHIHCVFQVLDPMRLDARIAEKPNGRKPGAALENDLDLQVMRALWGKTTVIPVIGKADTLTTGHMSYLKRTVWDAIKAAKLDPLEALELEEDSEEDAESDADGAESPNSGPSQPGARNGSRAHKRQSSLSLMESTNGDTPYLPMSVFSPDIYDLPPYAPPPQKGEKIGRRFPWGLADPYDANHCDFGRLRDSVFSEWRIELRDISRTTWYENWRTSRLKNLPGTRQRVQGGVTPVTSVPAGGRIASQSRQTSLQVNAPDNSAVGRKGSTTSTSHSVSAAYPSSSPSPVNNRLDVASTGRGMVSRASESNVSS